MRFWSGFEWFWMFFCGLDRGIFAKEATFWGILVGGCHHLESLPFIKCKHCDVY